MRTGQKCLKDMLRSAGSLAFLQGEHKCRSTIEKKYGKGAKYNHETSLGAPYYYVMKQKVLGYLDFLSFGAGHNPQTLEDSSTEFCQRNLAEFFPDSLY